MGANEQVKTVFSRGLDEFFSEIAELAKFSVNVFREGIKPPYEFKEVLNQCYKIVFTCRCYRIYTRISISDAIKADHDRVWCRFIFTGNVIHIYCA